MRNGTHPRPIPKAKEWLQNAVQQGTSIPGKERLEENRRCEEVLGPKGYGDNKRIHLHAFKKKRYWIGLVGETKKQLGFEYVFLSFTSFHVFLSLYFLNKNANGGLHRCMFTD